MFKKKMTRKNGESELDACLRWAEAELAHIKWAYNLGINPLPAYRKKGYETRFIREHGEDGGAEILILRKRGIEYTLPVYAGSRGKWEISVKKI